MGRNTPTGKLVLEGWKDGRMEEFDNLIIIQFDNGRMEEWKDGMME